MADTDIGFRQCDGVGGGRLGDEFLLLRQNSDFPEALFRKEPPAVTSSYTSP
jgi:hypothetical protein